MKTLLTGYNGFLGKIILSVFSNNRFEVKTLSRSSGADFSFDLSKEVPVFSEAFDCIIHAAGKAHIVPITQEESEAFFKVNVKGTENLLLGLERSCLPKSFVFISTVAVYGIIEGCDVDEGFGLLAEDHYGKSKIEAEKIVEAWCEKNDVICTILRLPLIAGPNPPGNLKSMINGIKKNYYFDIAGGKARKSIVLAEDVARIIPKAAEIGGIYNLADGYHPSFSELSQLIAAQLGKNKPANIPAWLAASIAKTGDWLGPKAPLNSDKLRKITSDLTFDDSKARKMLGWNPTPVLEGFKIV